jgi:small subunit ribosomal protein S27
MELDELEHLLHRFRRSCKAVEFMPSTVHAIVRQFIRFGHMDSFLRVLDDRLNYGVFPDFYCYNFVMDHFLVQTDYLGAAKTACELMLQEDLSNDLSVAFAAHSCIMHLETPTGKPWHEPVEPSEDKGDPDEVSE